MPFLRLSRTLKRASAARLSRRGTFAATAVGLLAPYLRADTEAAARHAVAAAPPPPPPSGDPWPICETLDQHYCVSVLTVDGVDQLTVSEPAYTAMVSGSPTTPGNSVHGAVAWDVLSTTLGDLSETDQAKAVVLNIRVGLLPEPAITFMWLRDGYMRVTGDATAGRTWEFRGYPARRPLTDPSTPMSEQAATVETHAAGASLLHGHPTLVDQDQFEGYVGGSNYTSISMPVWKRSGWDIFVQSLHLMPDGSVTHGSYLTWVAPRALQRLDLTPQQATAGDLVVTRTDDGVVSPVAAEMSVVDGGVRIEINDLTFSSPTISISRRDRSGCASKCKRGRTCKNGRCVKKKKRKRKKKH